MTGSTCVPIAWREARGVLALEHQVVLRGDQRFPLGLDDGGRVALGDDRGPRDALAGREGIALVDRRAMRARAAGHGH
jgi:hypothetical protein